MINQIELSEVPTTYGYSRINWRIDGIPLPQYLTEWSAAFPDDKSMELMKPFEDLCPAWNTNLEWEGDVRFVWKVIALEQAVLPLLLCPDDLDFTCIVIVAEVKKDRDFVYWDRIGYVLHDREDFEEERRSGILKTEAYSDEDWDKYGDNIAWAEADSPEWRRWIGENWAEELYRRRMNYTLPYYETEGNVCWMKNVNWVFDRREYEAMTEEFWKLQTMKQEKE